MKDQLRNIGQIIRKMLRKIIPVRLRRLAKGIINGIAVSIGYNINTSDYWDSIWKEEGLDTWRRYDVLFRDITALVPPNSKVLDVGCGVCILLRLIKNSKEDVCAFGLDISTEAIKRLGKNTRGIVAALPHIPFLDNTFDVVIATEVLEHLSSPSDAVQEIHRVLKFNGLLIVSVPDSRLGPIDSRDHMRTYNRKSLERLLFNFFDEVETRHINDFDCIHLLSSSRKQNSTSGNTTEFNVKGDDICNLKISIVIPTFNRKELLKETLKSLFNQTYPKDKYEIIVCDDGSTDGTGGMVKKLTKETSSDLRYLKQENKGPASARNMGIYTAKGEIIGFTDDDCIASPRWIEYAVSFFDDDRIDGVQGSILRQSYEEKKFKKMFKFSYGVTHAEDDGFYLTGNIFYRKKVIIEAGCFDPELVAGEDTDLAYRIKRRGYEILFCEKKAMTVYHAVTDIGYLKFFKSLNKYEFSALHVKRYPEIRKSLYLGFILRKQDIYPIFVMLTIASVMLNKILFLNSYITYLLLLVSIVTYLWGRVFIDSRIKLYPLRIVAFIRNLIIDSLFLYHILRGSFRYRCFIV